MASSFICLGACSVLSGSPRMLASGWSESTKANRTVFFNSMVNVICINKKCWWIFLVKHACILFQSNEIFIQMPCSWNSAIVNASLSGAGAVLVEVRARYWLIFPASFACRLTCLDSCRCNFPGCFELMAPWFIMEINASALPSCFQDIWSMNTLTELTVLLCLHEILDENIVCSKILYLLLPLKVKWICSILDLLDLIY